MGWRRQGDAETDIEGDSGSDEASVPSDTVADGAVLDELSRAFGGDVSDQGSSAP